MRALQPKVLEIVKQFGTNDPIRIAHILGIEIKKLNMFGISKGLYGKYKDRQLICVDKGLSRDERVVVLAHEISHLLLHGKGRKNFDVHILTKREHDRMEHEANKFAFLLIAHTCLRNNPDMINGIENEQVQTVEETARLLDIFSCHNCRKTFDF